METYKNFKPSPFDSHISIRYEEGGSREEWLVCPCFRNRDSNCLDESNFACALEILEGESETVEVHRFGHWASGWFEIILIDPASPAAKVGEEIEASLEDYVILNEDHFSELEHEEAQRVWEQCYSNKERLEYIRRHIGQFSFRSFAIMLGCVRGNYFCGSASELLNP